MKYLIIIIPTILFGLGMYFNEPMIYAMPFLAFALALALMSKEKTT